MKLPSDNIISCFYETADDCVKVMDTSATLLSFNPKGFELMEIDDPSTVIGENWMGFWKDDMLPKARRAFEQAVLGVSAQFEGFCPTVKGSPRWWRVNVVPLKNEFGEVQWILAMSRDVSEMVRLREENSKLKLRLAGLAQTV
jgi:PAS domain S-box-containing protein